MATLITPRNLLASVLLLVLALHATTSTAEESKEAAGQDYLSKGCRYYCVYASRVYCCDDGSLQMPDDHNVNTGRCPLKSEQICKDDAVFLHLKAMKSGTTKTGSTMLSKIGDGTVMCASDGYCEEDERCCPSICHKREVCLKSLHNHKTKP